MSQLKISDIQAAQLVFLQRSYKLALNALAHDKPKPAKPAWKCEWAHCAKLGTDFDAPFDKPIIVWAYRPSVLILSLMVQMGAWEPPQLAAKWGNLI